MELNELVGKILEADKSYYNTGHSIMSDQEYDSLKNLVREKDPDHPLFSKVGDSPKESLWVKADHQIPMGSLEKVNTEEEFTAWATKFVGEILILQPKLDGLSLSLSYEGNKFVQAITRGDGSTGEDISANVKKMKGFKPEFNLSPEFYGSLRCEIILPMDYLDKINSILPEQNRYENSRNAASGISRRLDGRFSKYLQLMFYDIQSDEQMDEENKIKLLRELGLETVVYSLGDKDSMISAYNQLKAARRKLPYQIDGAVVKLNSTEKQADLGWVNGRPKGQIAWKFDPPGSATILNSVSWEVGRTGVVTPLGHCEPVEIDGSTIRKVTLHNIAEIERLGVGIGDLVMIIKANDVIPKVVSVIESKGNKIEIPTVCPSCGGSLDNDSIRLFCKSDTCPAKSHYRIMNWIKVVGIDNLGESTLSVLEDNGKVRSIKDLYGLSPESFSGFEGFGEKSVSKILQNIQKTKLLPLEKFLSGIGIPSLSTKTALDLVDNFKTVDGIFSVTVEELNKIKGYSDISSNAIVTGLKNFEKEIMDLLTVISIGAKQDGKFSGMSFCFTGAMEKPRPFYQGLVQKNGGKNDSSVIKTTTYLVCNENKGSSKSQKAEKLGVKIITVQEFMDLVGDIPEEPVKPDKVKTYSIFEE